MRPHSSFAFTRAFRIVLLFLVALLLAVGAAAQTIAAPTDKTVEIVPSQKWNDTGIDLHPGDLVQASATTAEGGNQPCDPQGVVGLANAGKLPLDSALPGALIGKLQEKSNTPVFIGAGRQLKITEAGRLYLGANLGAAASCSGKYSVKIHVVPGGANEVTSIKSKLASAAQIWMSGQLGGAKTEPAQNSGIVSDANQGSAVTPESGATSTTAAPTSTLSVSRAPLDAGLQKDLQALPRRVNDEFKNLGDMVNFVLIGSEKQVQDGLTAANWHVADTSTPGAVAKAILMATKKEDYLQMPMSQLYLFGRAQDFGYEQAEPYAMVASRHHFRIWKSTATYNGQPMWAGAGTHDIGFEKDQRNGKVTHKIDPAVDGERDHIGDSLQQAGTVKMMIYFTPSDPVQESKNATGGGFHSDGRVLVIFLQ
ncbi:MAG: LssY C-terminal domain-containing protein [Acidobacteriia bacterium]|nr:LssY C-terminal domain-containing protein [Terriglobia bacterium]